MEPVKQKNDKTTVMPMEEAQLEPPEEVPAKRARVVDAAEHAEMGSSSAASGDGVPARGANAPAEMGWYRVANGDQNPAEEAQGGDEPAAGDEAASGERVMEGRRIRNRRGPRQPTHNEREEHERDHWPPAAWRRFWTASRCVARGHPRSTQPRDMPIVSIDYFHLGATADAELSLEERRQQRKQRGDAEEEEGVPEGAIPALAIHDDASSSIYAFAVSR